MELRPYQQTAIDNIRNAFRRRARRVLLVSPTGSGKTVMFCYITKGAIAKNKRVTILVHRTELIDQVSDALTSLGVRHGVIAPGFPMQPSLPVQVASVFTLVKRLNKYDPPDLLVVDEAHHTVASTWEKVTDAYSYALVLGVTATPCRASGAGLDTSFDEMILGPTAMELIDLGALSPLRVYAPPPAALDGVKVRMGDYVTGQLAKAVDKPKITGDALDHYQKLTPGAPAVVFCVSVDHARHVSEQFMGAGINAISIDGTMDRGTRKSIIADYRAGKIMVLTSCDLVSEGFDVPGIITGISLRPTKSLGLWIQQTGRILRTMEGKKEAFLLDHAGNCMQHGLPIDDREWSLAGQDKEDKPKQTIKTCKVCYAINPVSASVCKECGAAFKAAAKPRELVHVNGVLVEVKTGWSAISEFSRSISAEQRDSLTSKDDLIAAGISAGMTAKQGSLWATTVLKARGIAESKRQARELGKARTLEGLVELGKQRGYAEGWALHIWNARQKKYGST